MARTWNAFGVHRPGGAAFNITVEINIPAKSNSRRVAGFVARDPASGREYLMHDGSVGGGRKGVGRDAYLAWSKSPLEEVSTSDGGSREGIVVCDVGAPEAPDRLWRFVTSVRRFKDAVKAGLLEDANFRRELSEYERYRREFSGREKGRRSASIDYLSYHGEVVEALCLERTAAAKTGERVYNSQLVDLYVRAGGVVTEVYEVKTRCERQSIYTAIGQLVTHAPADIRRIMVLPHGRVDDDLTSALTTSGISLRRFSLVGPKLKVILD